MPTYELTQAVWTLQYNHIRNVEADSGKEAIERAYEESMEWTFDGNSDSTFEVSYEVAQLEDNDGWGMTEVYETNCYNQQHNPSESFRLLHPKGWRHS